MKKAKRTSNRKVEKSTVKKILPMKDVTTSKRFEMVFSKEDDIRDAYHGNCDYTLRMSPKLAMSVEKTVQDWLDNNGIEMPQVEVRFTNAKGESCDEWMLFQRYEIALKTCANNWKIYHIAKSSFWPRIISSRPKLLIQHNSDDMLRMRNEIRSTSYGEKELDDCELAAKLIKE